MILFIGGPLDGHEREVPAEWPSFRVQTRHNPSPYYTMADAYAGAVSGQRSILRQCTYFRHKLPGGVDVFALSDHSLADVMNILLAAYPRKR